MSTCRDTYKGESLGKKLARLIFWNFVEITQKEQFRSKKHVVLASREGGDISVLLGMRVPKENIIAVDIVPDAVEACRERWPGIRVECGDVCAVLASLKDRPGSIFLDFCAPLSGDTLSTASHAQSFLGSEGFLGVAVLRGREQESHSTLPTNRHTRRRAKKIEGFADTTGTVRSALRDSRHPSLGRALFAYRALIVATPRIEARSMKLDVVIEYQSATSESKGVPMTIFGGPVRDHRGHLNNRVFAASMPTDLNKQMKALLAFTQTVDGSAIEDGELLLNVSKGTLAAWRAHDTRGTYGRFEGLSLGTTSVKDHK